MPVKVISDPSGSLPLLCVTKFTCSFLVCLKFSSDTSIAKRPDGQPFQLPGKCDRAVNTTLRYHVSLGMPPGAAVFRRVYIQAMVQDLKDQCRSCGESFPSIALEWGVGFPMDELWMLKMIREVYSPSKGLQKGPGNRQGCYFMLRG